jgi:hypothetical protein
MTPSRLTSVALTGDHWALSPMLRILLTTNLLPLALAFPPVASAHCPETPRHVRMVDSSGRLPLSMTTVPSSPPPARPRKRRDKLPNTCCSERGAPSKRSRRRFGRAREARPPLPVGSQPASARAGRPLDVRASAATGTFPAEALAGRAGLPDRADARDCTRRGTRSEHPRVHALGVD